MSGNGSRTPGNRAGAQRSGRQSGGHADHGAPAGGGTTDRATRTGGCSQQTRQVSQHAFQRPRHEARPPAGSPRNAGGTSGAPGSGPAGAAKAPDRTAGAGTTRSGTGSRMRAAAFGAAAGALSVGYAVGHLATESGRRVGRAVARPFVATNRVLQRAAASTFGAGSVLARRAVTMTALVLVTILMIGTGITAAVTAVTAQRADDPLPEVACANMAADLSGDSGSYTGKGVPAKALPWINNAVKYSTLHIPAAFFAYIMDRESDFNPTVFSDDVNGGTWGLFQINAEEWSKATGGGSWGSPDIKDPMIHAQYGAKYFDERLKGVRAMRKAHPDAAYTTQLTELEDLMIAHNAGEGNLARYPNLPDVTRSYLAEYKQKFPAYGGGTASGGTGGVGSGGIGDAMAADGGTSVLTTGPAHVQKAASVTFGFFKSESGLGSGISTVKSVGAKGLSVDYTVANDANGVTTGDALVAWAVDNAQSLNITTISWNKKTWSLAKSTEGWTALPDKGTPSANFTDRVRITYSATAKGNPASAGKPAAAQVAQPVADTKDTTDSDDCSSTSTRTGTSTSTGSVDFAVGGMTKAQAQNLINLYNQEGDAFLDKKYGDQGGPGSCGSNHAENCVSFSTYFMNKYTTFNQYAPGNGRSTAATIARMTGKKTQSNPVPYSIFSMDIGSYGHTGVVLGVQSDGSLIIGQADYCRKVGNVAIYPASKVSQMTFVDVSSLLKSKLGS